MIESAGILNRVFRRTAAVSASVLLLSAAAAFPAYAVSQGTELTDSITRAIQQAQNSSMSSGGVYIVNGGGESALPAGIGVTIRNPDGSIYTGSGGSSSGSSGGSSSGYSGGSSSGYSGGSSSGGYPTGSSGSSSSGSSTRGVPTGGTSSSSRDTGSRTYASGTVSPGGPGAVTTNNSGVQTDRVYLENSSQSTTASNGPKVTDMRMGEQFYQDYGVYCENLNNQYYIYSTVSNNGITDKPVTIEIPAGVAFSATKDGIPMSYSSKEVISEHGTYVFKFMIVTNPNMPVISQEIMQASFNFRIMDKTPEAKAAEESRAAAQAAASQPRQGSGSSFTPAQTAQTTVAPTAAVPETIPVTMEAPPETSPAETEAETAPEEPEFKSSADTGYTETYLPNEDVYRIDLKDGRYFLSSVPNGAMSPYAVTLDLSGLGSSLQGVRLLDNGEEQASLSQLMTFDYTGSYELLTDTGDGIAPFSFRVLGPSSGPLGYYTVPDTMKVTQFSKDGREMPGMAGADRLDLTRDGEYRITLTDIGNRLYELQFTIDTEPPVFNVNVQNHQANIEYVSQDVARVTITDSRGNSTTHQSPLYSVSEPGRYRISVQDNAGNTSSKTFTVRGELNPATPIAILMIIALAAAGVIFYLRTRKNTNVR